MTSQKIQITGTTHDGLGIGRLNNGQVVFVKDCFTGEEITLGLEIGKKKKIPIFNIKNKTKNLNQNSICEQENCGGCVFKKIPYDLQINEKERNLRNNFKKFFPELKHEEILQKPINAENKIEYRHRVNFQIFYNKTKWELGFFKTNTKELVPVNICTVLTKKIQLFYTPLLKIIEKYPKNFKFTKINIAETQNGILLTIYSKNPYLKISQLNEISNIPGLRNIVLKTGKQLQTLGPISGLYPKEISDSKNSIYNTNLHLEFSNQTFTQVNPKENYKLIQFLIKFIKNNIKNANFFEFHAGIGNFSVSLWQNGIKVFATELQKESVFFLNKNLRKIGVDNKQNIKCISDIDAFDLLLQTPFKNINSLLFDPPRTGIKELSKIKLPKNIQNIIYISCDQMTLFRDLKNLITQGFTLKTIQPFDFFPNTPHIENMVWLYRN